MGDVVQLLTCAQSQDPGTALWSLGMRTGRSRAELVDSQSSGHFVRTHVMRPTWHYLLPEDVRWIQRLTAAKLLQGLRGRQRQLGLTPRLLDRALGVFEELLVGGHAHTRSEIAAALAQRGLPHAGQPLAHQLMVGEAELVIVSGPPRESGEHTYALVDEFIPAVPGDRATSDRPDAVRELTRRFMLGHGPADERDLSRWSGLGLAEIRSALRDLAPTLESVALAGHTLWFDPRANGRTTRPRPAYLLPTFDEVRLTYPRTRFPSADAGSDRDRTLAQAGGGVVVVAHADVGRWRRTVRRTSVDVEVLLDVNLDAEARVGVESAAAELAAFHERSLHLRASLR